jgi:hypothetical protein
MIAETASECPRWREGRQDRLHALRQMREAHDHTGDQAECPRPHHDPGEVGPGRSWVPPRAGRLIGPGDHLEPEHVVHGDPVLEAVRPARVGRGVAADEETIGSGDRARRSSRVAGGLLSHRLMHRPHGGAAVREVRSTMFMRVIDTMTPPSGHRATDEAGARAARHDRHARGDRGNDGRHLGRRLGSTTASGALVERVHVAFGERPRQRPRGRGPTMS